MDRHLLQQISLVFQSTTNSHESCRQLSALLHNEAPKLLLLEYAAKAFVSQVQPEQASPFFLLIDRCQEENLCDPGLNGALLEWFIEEQPISSMKAVFDQVIRKFPFPQSGKNLLALKVCNSLLRRILASSESSLLSGEILCFIASTLPNSDRSGVNLKGEFSAEANRWFYPSSLQLGDESPTADVGQILNFLNSESPDPSNALLLFLQLARVFDFHASNLSAITPIGVRWVLQVFNSLLELIDCLPVRRSIELPPEVFTFETFCSSLPSSSTTQVLLIRVILLLQSLLYAVEFPSKGPPLYSTEFSLLEPLIREALNRVYRKTTGCFGDQFTHQMKLWMFSEKGVLRWKAEGCNQQSAPLQDLPRPCRLVAKEISIQSLEEAGQALAGANFGTPELTALFSQSLNLKLSLPDLGEFLSVVLEERSIDAELRQSKDPLFIFKSLRLLLRELENFDCMRDCGNVVEEFEAIVEKFLSATAAADAMATGSS